ncbi:LUD domain-containing protein [Streptomyces sp. ISL-22]|uniref:LUD domain-containing protein n=1 Tax=Streptomyces sp. ISL-22 TaxID=2819180 RepID=UPI001BEC7049|nr:LUD domain-containing protein [Streptomyces sp. ISL-22]MBT2437106.1 LUD domain-containing protein [Streptomyces sp. ISL-22]
MRGGGADGAGDPAADGSCDDGGLEGGPDAGTTPLAGSAPGRDAQADDFSAPASAEQLDRAIAAPRANGFTAELLDDAAAARARIKDLIPEGAGVFTGASETLRLSGIAQDIETGDRYQAIRPRVLKMDRATEFDEIRRLMTTPDVLVAGVAAVTETGSLVIASGSGSQLPASADGAARAIWVVGAQKVVPDLSTALRSGRRARPSVGDRAPRRSTGSRARSTVYLSSTPSRNPGAPPSCCCARPSDSDFPRGAGVGTCPPLCGCCRAQYSGGAGRSGAGAG